MDDLISRQAAIEAVFSSSVGKQMLSGHRDLIEILKHLPSIQPERKKGKWIKVSSGGRSIFACSECGRTIEEDTIDRLMPIRYPFCHCGADMRGEQNE